MSRRLVGLIFLLIITGVAFWAVTRIQTPPPAAVVSPSPSAISTIEPTASSAAVLGIQTKTIGCQSANSLPDVACTPGAVMPGVTAEQVCQSGYSQSVRDVPTRLKDQVYLEYGVLSHQSGQYEVDHLISLELGGSNEIANLWPEPADPRPGFHEKDKVENYLHQQVCSGQLSLEQAQQQISKDWLSVYRRVGL